MDIALSRLRPGEWIAGASAVLLLAVLFAVQWYGASGTGATRAGAISVNGWHGLAHLRWLVLVTNAAALGLLVAQATRRSPAIPVSMSVIVTTLGLLTTLALLYRTVINVPGREDAKPGAFVGLAAAAALLCGGYASMRQEGIAPCDERTEIETVPLAAPAIPRPADDS
jgi:hypothetical protein